MNESEFLSIFGVLSAAYPKSELPDQTIELYRMILIEYDPDVMLKAALYHIASSRFFPTVQELLEAQRNIIQADTGMDDSPYSSWARVMHLFRLGHGRHTNLDNLDIITDKDRRAIRAIGWTQICNSENLAIERAHYVAAYKEISQAENTSSLVRSIEPMYRQAVPLIGGGRQEVKKLADMKRSPA